MEAPGLPALRGEVFLVLAVVLEGEAGRDHADVGVAFFHPGRGLGLVAELLVLGQDFLPEGARGVGHEGPAPAVLRLLDGILLPLVAGLDGRAAVREAGRDADHDGDLEALGEVEGRPGHVVGFLLVGGLEAGDARELGEAARVLLVLRGVHARVVGDDDHEAALDLEEAGVDEGIGGHVEADVLHRDRRAPAREGCAKGRLVGCLLVRAPLGHEGAALGVTGLAGASFANEVLVKFHDLGRGRAGIGEGRRQARMDGAEGYRLIAHQCFKRHRYLQ